MKVIIVLLFLVSFTVTVNLSQKPKLDYCDNYNCKLPNCRCSSLSGNSSSNNPQFVVLSFDDAITIPLLQNYLRPTFWNRKNPDGCPVTGTFFIPHEYTDYSVVNSLYNRGFEIAAHSITKNYSQLYWRNADFKTINEEFSGQRLILSKFANISSVVITGARTPQLQINRNTFKALQSSGFQYDSSWPTLQKWPYHPYSLDFASHQSCHILECQSESVPGFWEMPIIDWVSSLGVNCNSVDGCAQETNIFEWMKENFNQIRKNGAPVSLRVNYSWFISNSTHATALNRFLDYLSTESNVYLVSYQQVLNWYQNPTSNFSSCQKISQRKCVPRLCFLKHNDSERIMSVCGNCPISYPWIGNPLGK